MSNMFCRRPPRHCSLSAPLSYAGVASVLAPALDRISQRERCHGRTVISHAIGMSLSQALMGSRDIWCACVLQRLGHYEIADCYFQLISWNFLCDNFIDECDSLPGHCFPRVMSGSPFLPWVNHLVCLLHCLHNAACSFIHWDLK